MSELETPPPWPPPSPAPPPSVPPPLVGYRPADPATHLVSAVVEVVLLAATAGVGWLIWWAVTWDLATTPAKQVLHLRVLDDRTGARATFRRMALRELFGKGLALAAGVGGLTAWIKFDQPWGKWVLAAGLAWALMHLSAGLADARGRGLWDSLAGTVVVVDEPVIRAGDRTSLAVSPAR